jgi:hypothetical protein
MLTLRSKHGQVRCKKGQSIRTTETVEVRVTDCTNGGARLRFVSAGTGIPCIRTPGGGQYAIRKGQKILVAPSMVLTVVGCLNGSVRLNVQPAPSGAAGTVLLSSPRGPKRDKHLDFTHPQRGPSAR